MPIRVLNLFLAFALLWSGLSTIEPLQAFDHTVLAHQHLTADARVVAPDPLGSVEDHHLDDLPIQGHSDPAHESPDSMPAGPVPGALLTATDQARSLTSAGARPLSLAGPLRPPRSVTLAS